jgi:hypothetical protein
MKNSELKSQIKSHTEILVAIPQATGVVNASITHSKGEGHTTSVF